MLTGSVLKCGEMFFMSYLRGRLTLTSDPKEAWFSQDEGAVKWMRERVELLSGLRCDVAVYTHAEGRVKA